MRVILGPVPWAAGTNAYEPLAGLRDYYERTVKPAYEPADMGTVLAMMAPPPPQGPACEPADAGTIRRMAGLDPVMPAR